MHDQINRENDLHVIIIYRKGLTTDVYGPYRSFEAAERADEFTNREHKREVDGLAENLAAAKLIRSKLHKLMGGF